MRTTCSASLPSIMRVDPAPAVRADDDDIGRPQGGLLDDDVCRSPGEALDRHRLDRHRGGRDAFPARCEDALAALRSPGRTVFM